MGCSTYLGLGWRYQPLAPGHPTSICDIGINLYLPCKCGSAFAIIMMMAAKNPRGASFCSLNIITFLPSLNFLFKKR